MFLENFRFGLRFGLKMTSELNFRATCVIYDLKNKIDYVETIYFERLTLR